MEDDVAPLHGAADRDGVGQVAADLLRADLGQPRVFAPREAPHLVAAIAQHAHDRPAEEPAAAGHQCPHRNLFAAQAASFSRKIFALCRMSTGNEG